MSQAPAGASVSLHSLGKLGQSAHAGPTPALQIRALQGGPVLVIPMAPRAT